MADRDIEQVVDQAEKVPEVTAEIHIDLAAAMVARPAPEPDDEESDDGR
jgi:hypothetical protein